MNEKIESSQLFKDVLTLLRGMKRNMLTKTENFDVNTFFFNRLLPNIYNMTHEESVKMVEMLILDNPKI
jgi:hypothetical protein